MNKKYLKLMLFAVLLALGAGLVVVQGCGSGTEASLKNIADLDATANDKQ